MLLSDLLKSIEEKRVINFRDTEISGIVYDSREAGPGRAFFCIKGLVTDGHLYTGEAVKKGAGALFVQRLPDAEIPEDVVLVKVGDTREALALCSSAFYGEPSDELKLTGITGTNGKTTTGFLIESIYREAGYETGLIGTVENHIGGTVEPVVRTTPESLDLQVLLRRMVDAGVEMAAMEVSSHALELHRADGCSFDTVVFTNLTQDHLDFHISLEEYFGAKRRLFTDEQFGPGRIAVINIDDPFGARLFEETVIPCISYGLGKDAQVRGTGVHVSPWGNRFNLEFDGRVLEVETKLQGRFNVYNSLAAAASCFEIGIDGDSVVDGLAALEGVPGRFENIDCGQDFTVIVDYAHTPDGIESLLQACREVTEGRVILVVGCGGDRDRSKRPLMGRVGVEMSDICYITSDNPRGEDPLAIIEMILEGVRHDFSPERYRVEEDRKKAIFSAIRSAEKGDLVVIAGKGHESGQIFADGVIPFDDREVAREGLREVAGAEY